MTTPSRPVIRAGGTPATLINVFTVDPADQQRLVEELERVTREVMRDRPGFVSTSIHAGADGTRVINYAQWRRPEDLQAALADPAVRARLQPVMALAVSADPQLYRVASVHATAPADAEP